MYNGLTNQKYLAIVISFSILCGAVVQLYEFYGKQKTAKMKHHQIIHFINTKKNKYTNT